MARRCARFAKIGSCCNDACAEKMVPHSVHIDSGGKRMLGRGDPLSESLPSLGIRSARVEAKITIEDGETRWQDFICWLLRASATENSSDNRILKTADEAVTRTFIAERLDELVQVLRGLLERGIIVKAFPRQLGAADLFPSAIGLLCRDTIAWELISPAFGDVVGLEVLFAIVREAEAAYLLRFRKMNFNPWLVSAVLGRACSPRHRSILTIVGVLQITAQFGHLLIRDELRTDGSECKIFPQIRRSEHF
jgi:hypothetical protein